MRGGARPADGGDGPDPVRLFAPPDARAAAELAAADAQRAASPAQLVALRAVRPVPRVEDRVTAWRKSYRRVT